MKVDKIASNHNEKLKNFENIEKCKQKKIKIVKEAGEADRANLNATQINKFEKIKKHTHIRLENTNRGNLL